MRVGVSEPVLCGCVTCVQHRTLITHETEPTNVIGSSVTPAPVSSGPVQPLGSTSDQSSGTETTPLAPPPPPPVTTTPVDPEQPAQSVDSTSFKFPPVSSEPAQALAPSASGSTQAPALGFAAFASRAPSFATSGSSPISFAPPVTSAAPVQALGTTTTTTSSSTSSPVQSSSPATFLFPPAFTSAAATSGPTQAPTFGSAASSSTPPPFDAPSPLRWGSLQANGPTNTSPPPFSFVPPAQGSDKTGSAFPPPFGYRPGGFARTDVVGGGSCCGGNRFSSPSGHAPRNPFGSFLHPGFGFGPLSGPNAQTTIPVSGRSPFWGGLGTVQGSRFPPYAPTPEFDNSGGPAKQIMSISASNSHGQKSHEELRWEDYKNGDKGGFGWFPPTAHTSPFSAPPVSPSLFAPPSRPDRPQMRTVDLTQRDMSGFPFGFNTPTAFQRPHEPAGVSSPASGCCTACGATSSSSPSGPLGFNVATSPPSAAATSLPGLFLSASGACPLLFATPNLAAYGTTATPGVQAYAIMFGTPNLAAQGITATPAVQAYPMMFGIPQLAAQGTATAPAVQAYPTMFGTPNLTAQGTTTAPAFQGTTTAPAFQAYPTMFGTPNLAGQGITTTPAPHTYPTMFGTPNLGGQSTTTPPASQPYPTMFGVAQATTTPAVQTYANNAMMFGTPSVGAQGITPAAQAYPAHGLPLLPFGAMSLQ